MKKVLILANGTSTLLFREELLAELVHQGYELYISTTKDDKNEYFKSMGATIIETEIDRRGVNPIKDLKLLLFYRKLLKQIRPDVVLSFTIKPNIYGGWCCGRAKIPFFPTITGLGTSANTKKWLKIITIMLYRQGLKKAIKVFCQNTTNRDFFQKNRIIGENIVLVPGSGVNLDRYSLQEYPEDDGTVRFLFVGRIMKEKGVDELLEAAKRLQTKYTQLVIDMVGGCDAEYQGHWNTENLPSSLHYQGKTDKVVSFHQSHHAAILPTYHEGMANALLEAAACGRPVLASKIHGCLETFEEGISGIGFNVKDVDDLCRAIEDFIRLPYKEKKQMGLNGRQKMEKEFDRKKVVAAYMSEINDVIKNIKQK